MSIRSLADPPRRYAVSPEGGSQPVWHRKERALFYVDPRCRLRKVAVSEVGGALKFGAPIELNVPSIGSGHASTQYDVGPDGRIYFLDREPAPRPAEVRVVLGWQALLSTQIVADAR